MGKVLMEITMSLDGYTTGPEVSAEAPLGRGGERLHVAPILLGAGGSPLFSGVRPELRLVPTQATNSPLATHLSYQVDACGVRA